MFNDNLQKSASRFLDSETALNYLALVTGTAALITAVVVGLKAFGLIESVFGL